jgi:hypothetical protein
VTAVRGSRRCAVIDTDDGPKIDEIRRATADCLEQSPTWLTILSGSSNTPTAIRFCRTWSNCDRPYELPNAHVSRPICSLSGIEVSAAPRTAWPTMILMRPSLLTLAGNCHLVTQEPAHTDGDVAIDCSVRPGRSS